MRYHTPATFEDASAIAAATSGVTRFLAGGTDVLVQMRADIVTPDDLIDIKHIPGVKDIVQEDDKCWSIGAAVAGAELTAHAGLCADWPGVVEGMGLVGSTATSATARRRRIRFPALRLLAPRFRLSAPRGRGR